MSYQDQFETDVFETESGPLKITFLGHGSLLINFKDQMIYIDPYGKVADYSKLPKGDIIFITHEHQDHLDLNALASVRTEDTRLVMNKACQDKLAGGTVMQNGDELTIDGIQVKAVAAYNSVHKRESGVPFHPKGVGNGYVLTFGDLRVYIAGDTEDIPEMEELGDIDIAFLPMNLPYTMTPEMTANAAKIVRPRILYPYHYGQTDTRKLKDLLQDEQGLEVRIRKMA